MVHECGGRGSNSLKEWIQKVVEAAATRYIKAVTKDDPTASTIGRSFGTTGAHVRRSNRPTRRPGGINGALYVGGAGRGVGVSLYS